MSLITAMHASEGLSYHIVITTTNKKLITGWEYQNVTLITWPVNCLLTYAYPQISTELEAVPVQGIYMEKRKW